MIYTVVKRRHAYFYCAGARRSQCDQAYMSATTLEHELIRHYSLVKLDDDFRATVTKMLDETVRRGQSWCKTEMVELMRLYSNLHSGLGRAPQLLIEARQQRREASLPPKRQLQRRLTEAERDKLRADYAAGATIRGLARTWHLHRETIRRVLRGAKTSGAGMVMRSPTVTRIGECAAVRP
jgi:hypothetical protein